jgi:hypothetical protein
MRQGCVQHIHVQGLRVRLSKLDLLQWSSCIDDIRTAVLPRCSTV